MIEYFTSVPSEKYRHSAERTLVTAVGRECGRRVTYAEIRGCNPGTVPMDFVLASHVAFTRYKRRRVQTTEQNDE